ncbi:Tudor/PWWP/MBT [Hysterangium stoloniferum]|nr:Tudor/PWWP/MBT [Hysterangium stoloniferum]
MSSNKKSKDVGEHDYKVSDVVLAKIRGYPRWPGMVVDPESVPPAVARERPASKKTKFYCVRFFPAGDYSWAVSKDLSLLQKHEIEAYINEPHKKSGDLLSGYKIAMNPSEWEAKLEEKRAALEELEADEEVDQLDEADEDRGEDEPKKAKAGKKRKRESEVKPKKKKEPKKAAAAAAAGAEAKEKKTSSAKKKAPGKKNGIRSKETIESEDDGEGEQGEDAPAESSKKAGPGSKRSKKDKGEEEKALDHLVDNPDANKVREWRHKLQRAFLNKTTPKAEEMPEYDQLFTVIENHELTIDQLTLGKVMRHISQLDQTKYPIANEERYNIRGRADALLEKWQKLIAEAELSGANGGSVNGSKAEKAEKSTTKTVESKESEAKPSTNGNTSVEKPDNDAPETDVTVAPTADEEFPMDIADD